MNDWWRENHLTEDSAESFLEMIRAWRVYRGDRDRLGLAIRRLGSLPSRVGRFGFRYWGGDAGRRLVQEDMAHDQAHQGRAPVHLNGNRGRANRRRRAARCGRRQPRQAHQDGETDQGGDPGGEYEGYEDRQARNAAGNAGVHQAQERRKPAVETDLGGLFDFHQDETKDAVRCLLKNRALASTTTSRRRRLSWWSPRLPTAPAMKAGNAGTTRMKRRSGGGCAGQGPFIQRSETPRLRKRHVH